VGGFCFENTLPDEAGLVRICGPGFVGGILKGEDRYLQKSHCYYAPEQEVWVEFTADYHDQTDPIKEIVEVFVTREPLCDKSYVPRKRFEKFATPKGIQIGSLENDVIRAYGDPTRIDDSIERERRDPRYKSTQLASKYGSRVFVYLAGEDSLLRAHFYIKDGRVHSILVSVSE